MNTRKILIIVVIIICVFAVGYGIYFQLVGKTNQEIKKNSNNNINNNSAQESEIKNLDDLFDNKLNLQGYNLELEGKNKISNDNEVVFTNYTVNQIYEGKYNIVANIPIININTEKIIKIDREINSIFRTKIDSIIAASDTQNAINTIYTVDYTAYLNENILSLVIKATLKEGSNTQRLIIKAYTYNLSTDEEIPLENILTIKGKNSKDVSREIKRVVQEGISHTDNLAALGYTVFERDINSDMYEIKNSDNYFLGLNGVIYIIYAYGNSNNTSESDIVVIK